METFEITLGEEVLMVQPLENETFQIFRAGTLLATVSPCTDEVTNCLKWETSDLIPIEYLVQIGEAIELHER